MLRRPLSSTLTSTLFTYTPLFRSGFDAFGFEAFGFETFGFEALGFEVFGLEALGFEAFGFEAFGFQALGFQALGFRLPGSGLFCQIGSAHVCTPVTNAHLVCRLLLEKKTKHKNTLPRQLLHS